MNPEQQFKLLLKEYKQHRKPTLRRTSEYVTPFQVLISCLLSLRTQDKNTEKASNSLYAVAKTPEEILKLPLPKLEKLIFSSGHYKKKARTIKEVSKVILNDFNNKVPKTKEELLSIKGVGPKTTNIVLSFAYGKNVIAIDSHCHRLPNRMGWIKTKTPEQTEEQLMKILPKNLWPEVNTTLILFGKTICQPISPHCSKCILNNTCPKINVKKSR